MWCFDFLWENNRRGFLSLRLVSPARMVIFASRTRCLSFERTFLGVWLFSSSCSDPSREGALRELWTGRPAAGFFWISSRCRGGQHV